MRVDVERRVLYIGQTRKLPPPQIKKRKKGKCSNDNIINFEFIVLKTTCAYGCSQMKKITPTSCYLKKERKITIASTLVYTPLVSTEARKLNIHIHVFRLQNLTTVGLQVSSNGLLTAVLHHSSLSFCNTRIYFFGLQDCERNQSKMSWSFIHLPYTCMYVCLTVTMIMKVMVVIIH